MECLVSFIMPKKIKISEVKNFHIFLQLHLKLNYRAGKVGNLKTSHRKTYFQELKIKIPTSSFLNTTLQKPKLEKWKTWYISINCEKYIFAISKMNKKHPNSAPGHFFENTKKMPFFLTEIYTSLYILTHCVTILHQGRSTACHHIWPKWCDLDGMRAQQWKKWRKADFFPCHILFAFFSWPQ